MKIENLTAIIDSREMSETAFQASQLRQQFHAGEIAELPEWAKESHDPSQVLALPLAELRDATWIERPHPTRKGWLRTTCSETGRFIGNRPVVDQTKTQTQKKRNWMNEITK